MISPLLPAAGRLLISEPFMLDPNFKRSVIYLTQYDDTGATGFVLNQRNDAVFGDVISDVPYSEIPVYTGGPVGTDTLHFLHTLPDKISNGLEVLPGLFWGGDFEQIKEMAKAGVIDPAGIKFFVGYSGWSAGQLDAEINENVWLVSETADFDIIFSQDEAELWKNAVRGLGSRFAHIANFPEDPALN
ncbi:MAG: YqgE/AlgH family protein [Mucilaginibacter polytrichastri]|nr:YqgE/AlgH family protein [Mucilaginibacter polytrichastri]